MQIQNPKAQKAPEKIFARSAYNQILATHPAEFTQKVRSGEWAFLDDEEFHKEQDKTLPPGHHTMSDGRVFTID